MLKLWQRSRLMGSRSEAMREEALEMLRDWAKPGDLDRVMNRHLPLPEREAAPARDALAAVLETKSLTDMPILALSVAADLGIKQAVQPLEKIARDTAAKTQTRYRCHQEFDQTRQECGGTSRESAGER